MTMQKEFKYNPDAHYPAVGPRFEKKDVDIINQTIVISSDGKSFKVVFQDIFSKYKLPNLTSKDMVDDWNTNFMSYWQHQLNFAIWCATTSCGINYNTHLKAEGLLGSLFLFHFYYQTRRILQEISAALPQSKNWSGYNNSYDRAAYEKICNEFNINPNTDWRTIKKFHIHTSWSDFNYFKSNNFVFKKVYDQLDYNKMTFGKPEYVQMKCGSSMCSFPVKKVHIDYIEQDDLINDMWSIFILDKSNGFTRAGIERINDSIRTYCWAILGSQSQTRTDILGTGTASDAQKQFLNLVEDAINTPVDLPHQLSRYQDTLKYARSKVDFVYGEDLYMSPSDMEIRLGKFQDYNNKIVVATTDHNLGLNNNINTTPIPPKQISILQGTKTKQVQPVYNSYTSS